MAPLMLAIIFAVVFQPFYRRILKHTAGYQGLAAFLTSVIVISILFIPVTFLGTRIFDESTNLYSSLSDGKGQVYLEKISDFLIGTLEKISPGIGGSFPDISKSFDNYAKDGLSWVIKHLGETFTEVTGLFLNLFIFLIALYYLLKDGSELKKVLIKLSPLSDSDDEGVFNKLELAVNSVVKGSLLVALTQGIFAAVGFTVFGLPNSILWGTVAAVAALIPGVGTSLVVLPAVLFLFLTSSIFSAVGLLIWGIFAVGLIDNFLGPNLVGKGMKLHPLLVLLSVLGGLSFFGFAGIFLGPLTISLLFALLNIYSARQLSAN